MRLPFTLSLTHVLSSNSFYICLRNERGNKQKKTSLVYNISLAGTLLMIELVARKKHINIDFAVAKTSHTINIYYMA